MASYPQDVPPPPPLPRHTHHAFFAHHEDEESFLRCVLSILTALGYKHVRTGQCRAGANRFSFCTDSIFSAKHAVVCLSPQYLGDRYCRYQTDQVLYIKGANRVICAQLRPCRIPRELRRCYVLPGKDVTSAVKALIRCLANPRFIRRRRGMGCLSNVYGGMKVLAKVLCCKYQKKARQALAEKYSIQRQYQKGANTPVRCANHPCSHTCKAKEICFHLRQCPYQLVKCPGAHCPVQVQRHNLGSHINKCPFSASLSGNGTRNRCNLQETAVVKAKRSSFQCGVSGATFRQVLKRKRKIPNVSRFRHIQKVPCIIAEHIKAIAMAIRSIAERALNIDNNEKSSDCLSDSLYEITTRNLTFSPTLCPNPHCGEIVQKSQLPHHLTSCRFTPLPCPFDGCIFKQEHLRRNELVEHVRVCSCADVQCACGALVPKLEFMRHHEAVCPARNVKCVLCKKMVDRLELGHHRRDKCHQRLALCPYCGQLLTVAKYVSHLAEEHLYDDDTDTEKETQEITTSTAHSANVISPKQNHWTTDQQQCIQPPVVNSGCKVQDESEDATWEELVQLTTHPNLSNVRHLRQDSAGKNKIPHDTMKNILGVPKNVHQFSKSGDPNEETAAGFQEGTCLCDPMGSSKFVPEFEGCKSVGNAPGVPGNSATISKGTTQGRENSERDVLGVRGVGVTETVGKEPQDVDCEAHCGAIPEDSTEPQFGECRLAPDPESSYKANVHVEKARQTSSAGAKTSFPNGTVFTGARSHSNMSIIDTSRSDGETATGTKTKCSKAGTGAHILDSEHGLASETNQIEIKAPDLDKKLSMQVRDAYGRTSPEKIKGKTNGGNLTVEVVESEQASKSSTSATELSWRQSGSYTIIGEVRMDNKSCQLDLSESEVDSDYHAEVTNFNCAEGEVAMVLKRKILSAMKNQKSWSFNTSDDYVTKNVREVSDHLPAASDGYNELDPCCRKETESNHDLSSGDKGFDQEEEFVLVSPEDLSDFPVGADVLCTWSERGNSITRPKNCFLKLFGRKNKETKARSQSCPVKNKEPVHVESPRKFQGFKSLFRGNLCPFSLKDTIDHLYEKSYLTLKEKKKFETHAKKVKTLLCPLDEALYRSIEYHNPDLFGVVQDVIKAFQAGNLDRNITFFEHVCERYAVIFKRRQKQRKDGGQLTFSSNFSSQQSCHEKASRKVADEVLPPGVAEYLFLK
ncbi:uncharacterized protein LOC106152837 [Lingula anatina]|uniref:Uncharacterized protein LOC106152837 n=1 Tax=Lingula anatina TaxID=7574 RepID=A0A1S3H7S8_LINAN|nr:uncharacterized protein LOC106152837 [Lingula anatina]|eukprot:XP_013382032.1 uncharacterized protein LOC106152837 [Lingula anatina]